MVGTARSGAIARSGVYAQGYLRPRRTERERRGEGDRHRVTASTEAMRGGMRGTDVFANSCRVRAERRASRPNSIPTRFGSRAKRIRVRRPHATAPRFSASSPTASSAPTSSLTCVYSSWIQPRARRRFKPSSTSSPPTGSAPRRPPSRPRATSSVALKRSIARDDRAESSAVDAIEAIARSFRV